jgi:hypothetical protein
MLVFDVVIKVVVSEKIFCFPNPTIFVFEVGDVLKHAVVSDALKEFVNSHHALLTKTMFKYILKFFQTFSGVHFTFYLC